MVCLHLNNSENICVLTRDLCINSENWCSATFLWMQPKSNFWVALSFVSWPRVTCTALVLLGTGGTELGQGWEGRVGWCAALRGKRGHIRDLISVPAMNHCTACAWSVLSKQDFRRMEGEVPCALSKGWMGQQSVHLPERALGLTGSSKPRFLSQPHEKLSNEIILLCNSGAYSCFSFHECFSKKMVLMCPIHVYPTSVTGAFLNEQDIS